MIGFSAGAHKNAELVYDAFAAIKRSLSIKGCPYDNAVAKSNYKMFKTEFIKGRNFESLEQLKIKLADNVHWFNNI